MTDHLEDLLQTWIQMELSIRGNRILSDFSFNEIVVCQMLLHYEQENEPLTATDLCHHMRLLKSQMNRLLSGMEEKKLIKRTRSDSDRRKVYVQLDALGKQLYSEEHQRIRGIMETLYQGLGQKQFAELSRLMQSATEIVDQEIYDFGGNNEYQNYHRLCLRHDTGGSKKI